MTRIDNFDRTIYHLPEGKYSLMTKDDVKNSFYTIGFIGTLVTLSAYASKTFSAQKEDISKEVFEDTPAMYLGYNHTTGGCISRGYIHFDTDGDKKTTELRGSIDIFHLFEAGASLKGKEGKIMKIAEWKKLPGLEKLNIQKIR